MPRTAAGRYSSLRPVASGRPPGPSTGAAMAGTVEAAQRGRGTAATTGDSVATPSGHRAIATTWTRSPRRNCRGSRKPRYGGEPSAATRRQAPPARFRANETLTGSSDADGRPRLHEVRQLVRPDDERRTHRRADGDGGEGANEHRLERGTDSVSRPAGLLSSLCAGPSSTCHSRSGVAVVTVTVARAVPALKAATYSCRDCGSKRLTTRRGPSARRTAVAPVASAGCAFRSAASSPQVGGDGVVADGQRRAGADGR